MEADPVLLADPDLPPPHSPEPEVDYGARRRRRPRSAPPPRPAHARAPPAADRALSPHAAAQRRLVAGVSVVCGSERKALRRPGARAAGGRGRALRGPVRGWERGRGPAPPSRRTRRAVVLEVFPLAAACAAARPGLTRPGPGAAEAAVHGA